MERLRLVWSRFAESVPVFAFAVMFAGFVIGIGSRYVFDAPVAWANEVCLIGYMWVTFWTSDILLKERQHIVFDVFYNLFPPRLRRVVALFITLSLALTFLACLPGTIDYWLFLRKRHSLALHLPMQFVFGGFVIFVVAVIVNAARRTWALLRPGWEEEL